VGETLEGRALGPRQRALLLELASLDSDEPIPATDLAERHGGSALLGLARRGYLELGSRSRLPEIAPGSPAGAMGGAGDDGRLAPVRARIVQAVADRTATSFLLEAGASDRRLVEATAIDACLAAGRTALVLVPEVALARPVLERLP